MNEKNTPETPSRADALQELKAHRHFIKYILDLPHPKETEVYRATKTLERIGLLMNHHNLTEEELKTGPELDDMKLVITKFINNLETSLEETNE